MLRIFCVPLITPRSLLTLSFCFADSNDEKSEMKEEILKSCAAASMGKDWLCSAFSHRLSAEKRGNPLKCVLAIVPACGARNR